MRCSETFESGDGCVGIDRHEGRDDVSLDGSAIGISYRRPLSELSKLSP